MKMVGLTRFSDEAVTPPPWIPEECWKPIAIAWDDPKFKKNRLIASQNRRTVMGNCLSKHTGGSVCFVGHADRMNQLKSKAKEKYGENISCTPNDITLWMDASSQASTGPDKGRYYGLPQVESVRKIPRDEGGSSSGGRCSTNEHVDMLTEQYMAQCDEMTQMKEQVMQMAEKEALEKRLEDICASLNLQNSSTPP